MSFFIRPKRKKEKSSGVKVENGTQNKKKRFKNDELTSSESEEEGGNKSVDEQHLPEYENESAQEKRLRLAKIYLQEIEREEKERLENDEDTISNRLKEDYLKQLGRLRKEVASEYKNADLNNIQLLRCKEHKNTITCLCVSFDNKYIFSGSKDGGIVKWSIPEKKKVGSIPFKKRNLVLQNSKIEGHSSTIMCIAVSNDFKFLAVGDCSHDIQIWTPETLTHLNTLHGHRDRVTGLVFRRDTHYLYSCSKDRSVKVWSLDEMCYLETLFGHQDAVVAIDALTRERAVTAGGIDGTLRVWKIAEESQLIFNAVGNVDCVKLINEEHFISASDIGELCVWSVSKKKPLCSVTETHGHNSVNQQPNWITSLASLVNTDLIATGSNDGFIRLWKISNSCRSVTLLFTIPITGFVNSLEFTSDGQYLIAGIGQEHRCGRWSTIKEAKNGIVIIPLCK